MDKRQGKDRQRKNMSHKTAGGHKQKMNDRIVIFMMIICLLLIVNLIFSFYLQVQIGSIRKSINQAREQNEDYQATSGSIEGQLLSSGGSRISYGVMGNNKNSGNAESNSQQSLGSHSGGTDFSGKNPESGGDAGSSSGKTEVDYVELCGLSEVDKPMLRSQREVLERLAELAKDSDVIKEIYENEAAYPDKMLESLANNPEMANYVAGYPEMAEKPAEDRKTGGGITEREKEQEYPLFLQWDPRWGYMEYGEYSNVGLAGCGPTCLSMVMYYLLENQELTPDKIARYSMDNGYYVWGTGTAWALLEDYPAMYGINVRQAGKSEETMKAALDQGRIIICSMGPGDFTAGGHFIVIYGYDRNGFKVNDPNCVARSRKQWTYDQIGWQIKQVWTYGDAGSADILTEGNYGGSGIVTGYGGDEGDDSNGAAGNDEASDGSDGGRGSHGTDQGDDGAGNENDGRYDDNGYGNDAGHVSGGNHAGRG